MSDDMDIHEYVVGRFATAERRDDVILFPALGMTCVVGTGAADAYMCFFNGSEWVRLATA